MKIINLVRQRKSESQLYFDQFLSEDFIIDAEQALRDAIAEFLKTEEGRKTIKDTCEDFNWGDAVLEVSDETWKKYGITPFKNGMNVTISRIEEVIVNQDEVLIDDEYYEISDDEN